MKKLIIFFVLAVAVAILVSQYNNIQKKPVPINNTVVSPSPKEIRFNAYFAIFTNGTFRLFNDEKYHNKSLDVFIEKTNVNKVVVKKSNVTWNDFFKTLPMSLKKECIITGTGQEFCNTATHSLKFYINGRMDENVLEKQIKENDKLLVSYGPKNEEVRDQLEKLSANK